MPLLAHEEESAATVTVVSSNFQWKMRVAELLLVMPSSKITVTEAATVATKTIFAFIVVLLIKLKYRANRTW